MFTLEQKNICGTTLQIVKLHFSMCFCLQKAQVQNNEKITLAIIGLFCLMLTVLLLEMIANIKLEGKQFYQFPSTIALKVPYISAR